METFGDRYVNSSRAIKDLKIQPEGQSIIAKLKGFGVDIREDTRFKDIPSYVAKKIVKQELFHVAIGGSYKEAQQLIKYGVDKDSVYYFEFEDRHVVDIAINCGNIDVVRALVESGCNLLHTSRDGHDPLRLAFERGYYDIVEMLVKEFNMNPFKNDQQGNSLFHTFVQCPNVTHPRNGNLIRSAKRLLRAILQHPKAQACINLADKDSRTPIMNALAASSTQVADILLDFGACVTTRPDIDGDTCLSLVTFLPRNKRLVRRVLETIKKDHFRFYQNDLDGHEQLQTYLHTGLMSQGDLSVPEFIIHNSNIPKENPGMLDIFEEYFTDPEIIDRRFKKLSTLLLTAARKFNYPLFVRILRSGADVSILDDCEEDVVTMTANHFYFKKDDRLYRALVEVGVVNRTAIKKLWALRFDGFQKPHKGAFFMAECASKSIRSLPFLIRNSLRSSPEVRKKVMLQAKIFGLPKSCLDFLNFQDLLDGKDFISVNMEFPETLYARQRYLNDITPYATYTPYS